MWQSSVVRPLFRNANGLAVVSGAGSPSWAPYPSIGSPTSPGHVLPCGDLSRRQKAPAALPLPSQQLSQGQRLPAHTHGELLLVPAVARQSGRARAPLAVGNGMGLSRH